MKNHKFEVAFFGAIALVLIFAVSAFANGWKLPNLAAATTDGKIIQKELRRIAKALEAGNKIQKDILKEMKKQ